MAKPLTAAAVERIKPGLSREEIPDGLLPGFYLIIQPSGAKSWAVRYRHGARTRKLTIGKTSALSLSEARDAAREALRIVARGEDPATIRKAAQIAASAGSHDTVEAVIGEWLKRDQMKNRSFPEVKRTIARDVLPVWKGRAIADIKRHDCVRLIDTVHDRAPILALRIHAYLHRLFKWSVGRGIVDASPMADLPKPGREISRDRFLSDGELLSVWLGCHELGWPFGPAIQLLALTGCRREEIASLRWSEVEGDTIRLGGNRTKTKEARIVPLAPLAIEILQSLPQVNQSEFVFTTNGRTPISGWSRAKCSLDLKSGVADWRLHDLRRTFATGLQQLGVRLEVIEAALGHISGSRAGIVGVYQRHGFEPETRKAAELWSDYIRSLWSPRLEDGMIAPRALV